MRIASEQCVKSSNSDPHHPLELQQPSFGHSVFDIRLEDVLLSDLVVLVLALGGVPKFSGAFQVPLVDFKLSRDKVVFKERCLSGLGFSKDVLVPTRAQVDRYKHLRASLFHQVLAKGRKLYG